MAEAAASPEKLEQLRQLGVDPLAVRRSHLPIEYAEVTKAAGGDSRPRFVLSTEKPDLVGDIVVQDGLEPVSDRLPAQVDHSGRMRDLIGWWTDLEVKGKRTLATLNLLKPGITDMADLVRELHENDVRMAASIGFVPDWYGEGGYELIRDSANERVTGIKFNRSKLIEASVVVVPANPGSLSVKGLEIARRRGFTAERLNSFVLSTASQQLLRGMPLHDYQARIADAVKTADALLKGERP